MKLRFFAISQQDKHLRDVRGVLAVSPEAVDCERVRRWAIEFGVVDTWDDCLRRPGQE